MKARLHRLKTNTASRLMLKIPQPLQPVYAKLVEKGALIGDWYDVSITLPKRPRSTGPNSQNNHSWGHAVQIAQETGHEVSEIEYIAKMRAVAGGYPYKVLAGELIPISQAHASVEDLIKLIEAYHQIAAELGVVLNEQE